MGRKLERTWAEWLDSGTWRRFGRSPVGRHLMRSSAFRFADTTRRFAETSIRHAKSPGALAAVGTFVLFLGAVTSGCSPRRGPLDPSWPAERHTVSWTPDTVTAVDRLIRQFDFLDGHACTG